jgi:hypothetical protein
MLRNFGGVLYTLDFVGVTVNLVSLRLCAEIVGVLFALCVWECSSLRRSLHRLANDLTGQHIDTIWLNHSR